MIRPFNHDDYPALASLSNLVEPDWPVTAELLAQWDKQRNPEHHHATFVDEHNGNILAFGQTGHDSHAFEEGKFWLGIGVHPEHRKAGLGRGLYQHLLHHLAPMQPKVLQVFTSEDQTVGVEWLQREGFRVVWKRYHSRLQTKGFDFAPYEGLEQTLSAHGIEIKSLADLNDPDAAHKLYELDWTLMQDVPMGVTLTKQSFEQWMKQEIDDPEFIKEACMIAIDPKRSDDLTGSFVGYTSLMKSVDHYGIGMTGVVREYRGKGIAKALKLATMQFVKRDSEHSGISEIRTMNDPPNVAMLGMNQALGFTRFPSYLRFQKALDGRTLEPFDEQRYLGTKRA
jgi:mycothiol synthase